MIIQCAVSISADHGELPLPRMKTELVQLGYSVWEDLLRDFFFFKMEMNDKVRFNEFV